MTSEPRIIEMDGRTYRVTWFRRYDGREIARVTVQVRTRNGKTTWRTLNGYGRARRLNEIARVLDLASDPGRPVPPHGSGP